MNQLVPFSRVQQKLLELESNKLVSRSLLDQSHGFPLVIEAASRIDLADWLHLSDELEGLISRHGAVLFRGFDISSTESFRRAAVAICGELFADNGELPRQNLSADIYTSTAYPSDRMISWHNENSFLHEWPARIVFCCLRKASEGGETPLCDSRRVYVHVPDDIRKKVESLGIIYVRTYGGGMGLAWETAFRTTDRAAVEEHFRQQGMKWEWLDDGRLHLRWRRPGVAPHFQTGERLWFNQITHFHTHMLGAETELFMQETFGEKYLPRHCYYGDGSQISASEVDAICEAYRSTQVVFPWAEGDVLAVDNMMVAHARNPYQGERKIAVAVGSLLNDSNLPL